MVTYEIFLLNCTPIWLGNIVFFKSSTVLRQIAKRNSTRWLIADNILVNIENLIFQKVIWKSHWINPRSNARLWTAVRTGQLSAPLILSLAISDNSVRRTLYPSDSARQWLVGKSLFCSFFGILSCASRSSNYNPSKVWTKRDFIANNTFIFIYVIRVDKQNVRNDVLLQPRQTVRTVHSRTRCHTVHFFPSVRIDRDDAKLFLFTNCRERPNRH